MIATRALRGPLVLVAALTLAACQAAPVAGPVGPAQVVTTASGVVVTIGPAVPRGSGRITLAPRVVDGGERRLMATVQRNTVASIDHVVYKITEQGNGSPDDAVTLSGPTMLNTITFSNLKNNTTYVVEAEAYDASSLLLNQDVAASATVTVGTDDRPAGAALLIKLDDVAFSGQATSNAVSVTDGAYTHPDGEGVVVAEPEGSALLAGGAAVAAAAPVDGIGAAAKFANPVDIAVGPDGNFYVADHDANAIRKITPGGLATTVAGGTAGDEDGAGRDAKFNNPTGIVVAPNGTIYVSDGTNHRIKRIDTSGNVLTIAGDGADAYNEGVGQAASFSAPRGLALDGSGNLYVADTGNAAIRKIAPDFTVTTLVAGGVLVQPYDLTTDANGDLLVVDRAGDAIRRVTLAGVMTNDQTTGLDDPKSIARRGNAIWVTDANRIMFAGVASPFGHFSGSIFAGAYLEAATAAAAEWADPHGLAIGQDDHLYVADTGNDRVRRVFLFPPS